MGFWVFPTFSGLGAFSLFPAFSGLGPLLASGLVGLFPFLGIFSTFSGLGAFWAFCGLLNLFPFFLGLSQPFLATQPFLGLLWASKPLQPFLASGPFLAFCGLLSLFPAFSGLEAFSGPFVGFCPLGLFSILLGLGASSRLLDLLPAVFLMNLPNGCETNYLKSLLRWRTWELAPLKFLI